jgi:hypothetical protein
MSVYVDRYEGLIWCVRCVPAEVELLSREYGKPRKSAGKRAKRAERFMQVNALRAAPFGRDRLEAKEIALRCCECGAIESSA